MSVTRNLHFHGKYVKGGNEGASEEQGWRLKVVLDGLRGDKGWVENFCWRFSPSGRYEPERFSSGVSIDRLVIRCDLARFQALCAARARITSGRFHLRSFYSSLSETETNERVDVNPAWSTDHSRNDSTQLFALAAQIADSHRDTTR